MPQRVSHWVHSRYPLLTGTFSISSRESRQSRRHLPLALPVILSLRGPPVGLCAPVSPVKRKAEAGVTRPLIPRRLAGVDGSALGECPKRAEQLPWRHLGRSCP